MAMVVLADARHCVEPGMIDLASVNRICKRTKKSQVISLRMVFGVASICVVSKGTQNS